MISSTEGLSDFTGVPAFITTEIFCPFVTFCPGAGDVEIIVFTGRVGSLALEVFPNSSPI